MVKSFIAQFFNTGILLLLANGNLSEHQPKLATKYLLSIGKYYDYDPKWFSEVGKLITKAMVLKCLMNCGYVVLFEIIRRYEFFFDTKFTLNRFVTRKTQMTSYEDSYTGGELLLYEKYTDMLVIFTVAMMYGIGMPILFPLAGFSMLALWVCERYDVARNVKLPPIMRNSISKRMIRELRWSPLLLLINGYWMLTNQQAFGNKTSEIVFNHDNMKANHKVCFPNFAHLSF